jgi:hypothetical protein
MTRRETIRCRVCTAPDRYRRTRTKYIMSNARLPLPPFTKAAAIQKVRIGEDGWILTTLSAFPKSSDWVYFAR